MSKTDLKAFETFDGKSQGVEGNRGNWPDLKCDRHTLQSVVNLEETLGNLAAISG